MMRGALGLVVVWLCVVGSDALQRAIAVLQSNGTNNVAGSVTFEQSTPDSMSVTLKLKNLTPNSIHGFHVHQFGDTTSITTTPPSTGYHFFPVCNGDSCREDQLHGFPPNQTRHAGDMGNVQANAIGEVDTQLVFGQSKMSLNDTLRSIVSRAIVIHDLADDGLQPYGNAGDVIAAGVIGIAQNSPEKNLLAANPVMSLICVFHDVSEFPPNANGPDNNHRGYAEISQFDLRTNPTLKIRIPTLTNFSSETDIYFQIREFGDLSNVPDSLGEKATVGAVREVLVNEVCDGERVYLVSTSQEDLKIYAGLGCSLTQNNKILSVGVFGLGNPDDQDTVFSNRYFTNGGNCDKSENSGNSNKLSGGAIAGIVIAVLFVVGVGAFFAVRGLAGKGGIAKANSRTMVGQRL